MKGKVFGEKINGVRVIGKVDDLSSLFTDYKKIVLSIGYNKIRGKVMQAGKKIGFEFPNLFCDNTYTSPFAAVGEGCAIFNNVFIQNGNKVGNATIKNESIKNDIDDGEVV